MGYKDKVATFVKKGGVQNQKVTPSLPMGVNDDIMDQNLGKPLTNVVGAQ